MRRLGPADRAEASRFAGGQGVSCFGDDRDGGVAEGGRDGGVAGGAIVGYRPLGGSMIRIRFRDDASKRRAVGYLLGRFAFKSWPTAVMLVPECALSSLALECISFIVEGPATYEQLTAITSVSR